MNQRSLSCKTKNDCHSYIYWQNGWQVVSFCGAMPYLLSYVWFLWYFQSPQTDSLRHLRQVLMGLTSPEGKKVLKFTGSSSWRNQINTFSVLYVLNSDQHMPVGVNNPKKLHKSFGSDFLMSDSNYLAGHSLTKLNLAAMKQ